MLSQQIFIEHILCAQVMDARGAAANTTMFSYLWAFVLVEEANSKQINNTIRS